MKIIGFKKSLLRAPDTCIPDYNIIEGIKLCCSPFISLAQSCVLDLRLPQNTTKKPHAVIEPAGQQLSMALRTTEVDEMSLWPKNLRRQYVETKRNRGMITTKRE